MNEISKIDKKLKDEYSSEVIEKAKSIILAILKSYNKINISKKSNTEFIDKFEYQKKSLSIVLPKFIWDYIEAFPGFKDINGAKIYTVLCIMLISEKINQSTVDDMKGTMIEVVTKLVDDLKISK